MCDNIYSRNTKFKDLSCGEQQFQTEQQGLEMDLTLKNKFILCSKIIELQRKGVVK